MNNSRLRLVMVTTGQCCPQPKLRNNLVAPNATFADLPTPGKCRGLSSLDRLADFAEP